MGWVRLDDSFATNPKILTVGPLGMAMQVAAICYANRHLTDGVILRCSTDHVEWFAGHLASMPFEFLVRTPDSLRASLARLGERLLRMAGRVG